MTDFNDLLTGYRRFRADDWARQRERWAKLAEGQSPSVMVIACSDSRIDPATVFDSRPGEIFVVRNVANLVPPFELGGLRHGVSAALEFAVTQLEVKEIIVLGHGQCGGISASMTRRFENKPPGEGGFIARWMAMLDDARDRIEEEHGCGAVGQHALELESVRLSIDNLRTFPCIPPREAAGTLRLIGAYFAISDGLLHVLDPQSGDFHPA